MPKFKRQGWLATGPRTGPRSSASTTVARVWPILLLVIAHISLVGCRGNNTNAGKLDAAASSPSSFSPSAILCGQPTDNLAHIPANYRTYAPPTKGGSYTDQNFGCTITRFTQNPTQGPWLSHAYASFPPFNADDTYLLLNVSDGTHQVVDMKGRVLVSSLPENTGGGSPPKWDRLIASKLWYEFGNTLRYCVVSRGACTSKIQHTFAEYSKIYIGGENSEGEMSDDGDHFAIVGVQKTGDQEAFVYKVSADTKGPVVTIGHHGYDYLDITHGNDIYFNTGVNGSAYGTGGGPYYQGVEIYSGATGAWLRQAVYWVNHSDRGMDPATGESIAVMFDGSANGADFPGCVPGIIKVNLSKNYPNNWTCLLSEAALNSNNIFEIIGGHISVGNNWAVVSYQDYRNPGTASYTLAFNWQDLWNEPYINEIFLIKLDGLQIIRLANHRGCSGSYPKQPKAAISHDARYAMFTSDYCQNPTPDYADEWLMKVQ